MSIAAFSTPGILAPFQAFFHWLVTDAVPVVRPASDQSPGSLQKYRLGDVASIGRRGHPRPLIDTGCRPLNPATQQSATRRATPTPALRKPPCAVRMVRVVEAGQAPASAGRMVISGRMADVCAELDRLASREGGHH